jgi:signal transduction histidine kinase
MLDQRLAELTLLNQITRAANAAVETDDLLRTITREIVQALPWDRVAIGTLQPDGVSLRWVIDQAPNAAPSLEGRYMTRADFPPMLDVLHASQIGVLNAADPLLTGTATEAVLQQLGLRTALVVPLHRQDEPLGVMFIGNAGTQQISADEMRLFETMGKLISEAIIRTRLYEEAQQANQLKSAFLASVSHELRTPLTSLIGFADMLRRGIFGPLPDSTNEPLAAMRHSSQTLLRLINDILDFSKMEAGHFSVDLYAVDLTAVVQNVVGTMRPQMHERGLALNMELAPDVPLVYANSARLEQVLTNLLSNAIKFTDEGTITVRVTHGGDYVRLSIQDTGIGIAPEQHGVLFQAFRQIESAYTRRFGGTGLGLAISRRLVELMGGALSMESTPGVGSTFHCDLRVAPISALKEVGASE